MSEQNQFTESQLQHALKEHAKANGIDTTKIDWSIIITSLLQIISAFKK